MATNFKPNYTIHPGVFLREEMEALGISQKELSDKSGISKTVINEIIHEKRRINGDVAVKLEKVMYSPAGYWLNLQALFDEAEARIRQRSEEATYEIEFVDIPIKSNLNKNFSFANCFTDYDFEYRGVA